MVGQAFGFCLPNRINPHGALSSAWRVWTRGGRPRFSCNFFLYRQFLCFTYFFKDLGLKKRKFVLSRFCCVFIVSAVFFRFCCVAFVCFCCVFFLNKFLFNVFISTGHVTSKIQSVLFLLKKHVYFYANQLS